MDDDETFLIIFRLALFYFGAHLMNTHRDAFTFGEHVSWWLGAIIVAALIIRWVLVHCRSDN